MNTLRPMTRALLATDGSEQAEAAATFARELDWPPGSTIAIASIVEGPPPGKLAMEVHGFDNWRRVLESVQREAHQQAQDSIAEAATILRQRHPALDVKEIVRFGEPAAELLALARSTEAELVIAGARGRTVLECLLLGSVSEALVTEAPCPVLIVREPVAALETVLVGLHAQDDAERLADVCLRLPLPAATRLVAVTASAPRPLVPVGRQPLAGGRMEALLEAWDVEERAAAEAAGKRFAARVRAVAPERSVATRIIRGELAPSLIESRADVAPALLEESQALDAALVVVGARERQGLAAKLGLGSVSRNLVRRARTGVLVVRGGAEA